jgi:hypothetical protein
MIFQKNWKTKKKNAFDDWFFHKNGWFLVVFGIITTNEWFIDCEFFLNNWNQHNQQRIIRTHPLLCLMICIGMFSDT